MRPLTARLLTALKVLFLSFHSDLFPRYFPLTFFLSSIIILLFFFFNPVSSSSLLCSFREVVLPSPATSSLYPTHTHSLFVLYSCTYTVLKYSVKKQTIIDEHKELGKNITEEHTHTLKTCWVNLLLRF